MNREEKIKAYRATFGSEMGQKVLKDLEKSFYYSTPTYVFDTKSPVEDTLIREGLRMSILHIHKILEMRLKGE